MYVVISSSQNIHPANAFVGYTVSSKSLASLCVAPKKKIDGIIMKYISS